MGDGGLKTSSGKVLPLSHFGVKPSSDLTDADGTAEMTFAPHEGRVPGFGGEQIASGSVTATVTVPPSPQGWWFLGRALEWPVRILYHEPRGFKFAGLKWRLDPPGGSGVSTFELVHARRCGDDPFARGQPGP